MSCRAATPRSGCCRAIRSATLNYGVRARQELKLNPNLTAVAGIGWETTQLKGINTVYRYNTVNVPTPTIGPPISADRQFQNTAPEFALVYKLNPEWQFRGRVATGYGTPQVGNLFVLSNGQNGNNTELKTQQNLGYDLGFDWTPNSALTLSATGFYEFFKNELVTQATPLECTKRELHIQRAEIGTSRGGDSRRLEVLSRLAIYGGLYLSRRSLHRIHREPHQRRRLQLQPCGQQDSRHLAERTHGAAGLRSDVGAACGPRRLRRGAVEGLVLHGQRQSAEGAWLRTGQSQRPLQDGPDFRLLQVAEFVSSKSGTCSTGPTSLPPTILATRSRQPALKISRTCWRTPRVRSTRVRRARSWRE